jgi:hypothetical protein
MVAMMRRSWRQLLLSSMETRMAMQLKPIWYSRTTMKRWPVLPVMIEELTMKSSVMK